MEDQAVEVIGQIGQCQFRLSPLDSDGADEQPEPVFLMREHMLDPGTDRGLAAFARAVALGMDFPWACDGGCDWSAYDRLAIPAVDADMAFIPEHRQGDIGSGLQSL